MSTPIPARETDTRFREVLSNSPVATGELYGWSAVAIASLALAGIFALLLAVSRVPGVEEVFPWPARFFEKGLVIHVVFSFVVWNLAVAGAMAHLATLSATEGKARWSGAGRASVAAFVAAFVALAVPALTDRGEPSLNNYVPVIIDPVYYVGLLALVVGMGLIGVRMLVNLPRRRHPLGVVELGASVSLGIVLIALFCFGVAAALLGEWPKTGADNEELFWGGGHVLQFATTALLITGWYYFVERVGGAGPRVAVWTRTALLFTLLAAAVLPVFYGIFDAFSFDQRAAFTWAQYALAPPTMVVALAALFGLSQRPGGTKLLTDPGSLTLVLSIAVFGLGGFLGIFVDGADTRTPAHYHGVIGGATLVSFGFFITLFLPLLDRAPKARRSCLALLWLFAVGQACHSLGLFWAGGYGAPRKTAGAAQGVEAVMAQTGLYLMGVGALVAVAGGVTFIVIGIRGLRQKPTGN